MDFPEIPSITAGSENGASLTWSETEQKPQLFQPLPRELRSYFFANKLTQDGSAEAAPPTSPPAYDKLDGKGINFSDIMEKYDSRGAMWCQMCSAVFKNRYVATSHFREQHQIRNIPCLFAKCTFVAETIQQSRDHRKEHRRPRKLLGVHLESPPKDLQDSKVDLIFQKPLALGLVEVKVPIASDEVGAPKVVTFSKQIVRGTRLVLEKKTMKPKYKCDQCERLFVNGFHAKIHVESHLDTYILCPHCGQQMKGQASLDLHMTKRHPQLTSTSVSCCCCEKVFASEKLLTKHRRAVSRKSSLPASLSSEVEEDTKPPQLEKFASQEGSECVRNLLGELFGERITPGEDFLQPSLLVDTPTSRPGSRMQMFVTLHGLRTKDAISQQIAQAKERAGSFEGRKNNGRKFGSRPEIRPTAGEICKRARNARRWLQKPLPQAVNKWDDYFMSCSSNEDWKHAQMQIVDKQVGAFQEHDHLSFPLECSDVFHDLFGWTGEGPLDGTPSGFGTCEIPTGISYICPSVGSSPQRSITTTLFPDYGGGNLDDVFIGSNCVDPDSDGPKFNIDSF